MAPFNFPLIRTSAVYHGSEWRKSLTEHGLSEAAVRMGGIERVAALNYLEQRDFARTARYGRPNAQRLEKRGLSLF